MTLFDPEPTALSDLGSNFFLTEADIGKPRATGAHPSTLANRLCHSTALTPARLAVCAPKVQELNGNVKVDAFEGPELTEEVCACS